MLQKKAIATFHYALNPTGYLLLGKSETIGSSAPFFAQLEKNYKIYVRKNDVTSRPTFEMNPRMPEADPMEEPNRTPKNPKADPASRDLDTVVDTLLLSQYVPASVVVNQDLDILQFRGSTGLFLEPLPGKASLNLLKMARPSLLFELRNTVHKAHKSGEPIRKTGLEIKVKSKTHQVAIEAVPLKTATEERLFLIIFEEVTTPALQESGKTGVRVRRIKQLEEELATLREDLHSIIEEQEANNEELQSANEEIISSNEELQSINEELETSKEEIESANEELQTINQELQQRNDQLTEAYAFAEDIFSTIREATLVLNSDLRVMSANQAFYTIFRVRPEATEGRLLYELGNRQWDIPQLRNMLDAVVQEDAQFQGFEVAHNFPEIGEKVMYLNARKVVRQHSQEAILVAIEDITEHRQVQRMLSEQEAWFHTIVDSAPTLIWVAGPDARYKYLNTAWTAYAGHPPKEERLHGWTADIHSDDREAYLAIYRKSFEERLPFSFEYRLRRNDGEYRWMQEKASPLFKPDGTFNGYLGTCTDVHLQKTLTQELDLRVQERTREVQKTAESLQAVLNSSPASIAYFKAIPESNDITDFTLVVCNQNFATLNNQPVSQMQGRQASQLFPNQWSAGMFDRFKQVVETGEPVYEEQQNSIPDTDRWWGSSIIKYDGGLVVTRLNVSGPGEG